MTGQADVFEKKGGEDAEHQASGQADGRVLERLGLDGFARREGGGGEAYLAAAGGGGDTQLLLFGEQVAVGLPG